MLRADVFFGRGHAGVWKPNSELNEALRQSYHTSKAVTHYERGKDMAIGKGGSGLAKLWPGEVILMSFSFCPTQSWCICFGCQIWLRQSGIRRESSSKISGNTLCKQALIFTLALIFKLMFATEC